MTVLGAHEVEDDEMTRLGHVGDGMCYGGKRANMEATRTG